MANVHHMKAMEIAIDLLENNLMGAKGLPNTIESLVKKRFTPCIHQKFFDQILQAYFSYKPGDMQSIKEAFLAKFLPDSKNVEVLFQRLKPLQKPNANPENNSELFMYFIAQAAQTFEPIVYEDPDIENIRDRLIKELQTHAKQAHVISAISHVAIAIASLVSAECIRMVISNFLVRRAVLIALPAYVSYFLRSRNTYPNKPTNYDPGGILQMIRRIEMACRNLDYLQARSAMDTLASALQKKVGAPKKKQE